mmetsp:Transcript_54941/g.174670  ORF Transcript_54941/g.174670 Transcript_54941/m.174670 type:complete len:249 (-) Transcript_54941:1221-1967(-)
MDQHIRNTFNNRSITQMDLWPLHPVDSFHRTEAPVPNSVRPLDPTLGDTLHVTRSKYPQAPTNYPPNFPPAGRGSKHDFQVPGIGVAAGMGRDPASLPPSAFPASTCNTGICGRAPAAAQTTVAGEPSLLDSLSSTGKEDLGRSTWHMLHTLAAQLPEHPSAQQQQDVNSLVKLLTRVYPCAECAKHFAETVSRHPPPVHSQKAFAQWLCQIHNEVNARLEKPIFDCSELQGRWGSIGCNGDTCAMHP